MWIFLLDQYLIITNVSFPACPYCRLAFQLCCLLIRFSLINKRSQGIHIKFLLNFSRVISYCVSNTAATHFFDFLSISIEMYIFAGKIAAAKGQYISKAIYGLLNSSRRRTKLTILSIFFTQDSEFRSFFGRIEETINCFRDLLTFRAYAWPKVITKNLPIQPIAIALANLW